MKRLEDIESQKTFKTKLREGASALRYERCEGVEEKLERIKTTFNTSAKTHLGGRIIQEKTGYQTAPGR